MGSTDACGESQEYVEFESSSLQAVYACATDSLSFTFTCLGREDSAQDFPKMVGVKQSRRKYGKRRNYSGADYESLRSAFRSLDSHELCRFTFNIVAEEKISKDEEADRAVDTCRRTPIAVQANR